MKHLLIIDIEATCYEKKEEAPKTFISEIIEIGAVVVNTETFQIVEEYQSFVKPELFPTLSPYCKQLTTISQEQADNGKDIETALEEIGNLYQKYDCVFASWGFYDKKIFKLTCQRLLISYPLGEEHISLKHQHGEWKNKRPMGMGKALEEHKLPLIGTHHRGIDDARNISQIACYMIQNGWSHPSLF